MSKIVAIDLGTTNSLIALMEGGRPVVIPTCEGTRLCPSIVAVDPRSGQRLVGEGARRQAITNPENTIWCIRRFMGRKFRDPEVQGALRRVAYKVTEAPNGDVQVWMGGRAYSPPEISAMILQKLKADAEAYLGEPVTQAVITVPACSNYHQRDATREAGRMAGLEVLRIINETSAASLAYGLHKRQDEQIAVYDLGGGALDISILSLGDGVYEVNSTSGDTFLGGDDFDERIVEWMASEFRREQGIDLREDRIALQRLKEAAERAKIELSTVVQTEINLPSISADVSGAKQLRMTLTRCKLEQLVGDLVDRSTRLVVQALEDAMVRSGDIDEVVLVGGQTRMPLVQETVRKLFGREPHRRAHPDEGVAMGAAVCAGVLGGEVKDVLLLDVTPLTLGIETLGGVATPVIERNTTIPTVRSQILTTGVDGQTSVEIHVVEGERPMAADNKTLARFVLDGIPPAPRGIPQIEVTFEIDADGILHVGAQDKATGRERWWGKPVPRPAATRPSARVTPLPGSAKEARPWRGWPLVIATAFVLGLLLFVCALVRFSSGGH